MTVNLRNTSGQPLDLNGRTVDVDEVVHVEGDLAPEKSQPEDGYLIGKGDDARVYPKVHWTDAGGSKKSKPDVPAPSSEETA